MICTQQLQTLETIHAMRQQEERYYRVSDYFSHSSIKNNTEDSSSSLFVNKSCRSLMADWCNNVGKACKYNSETVEIAMNCLDRFVESTITSSSSTSNAQEELMLLRDRGRFQLAVMAAFYSTVKIHEQEAIDPKLLSTLTHGAHTPEDIEQMESELLRSLSWRMNPPTVMSFVRKILDVVPDNQLNSSEKRIILDITKKQIEQIANGYEFSTYPNSYIAFASILNSVESWLYGDNYDSVGGNCDVFFYTNFKKTIGTILQVDDYNCISKLQNMIHKKQHGGTNVLYDSTTIDNTDTETIKAHELLYTEQSANTIIPNENTKTSRRSPQSVRRTSIAQAA